MPLIALIALLLLATPAAASRVPGPETGREVVVVANAEGGTVSVVDARSFEVLRELDVVPDGRSAQVEDDPVHALIGQSAIEAAGGTNLAQDQDVSPDGRTLYVSRGHRGDVAAFDLASGAMRWKARIPGLRSDHMTLSADGRRLYVSALTANEVVVVDTRAAAIVGRFATGQFPHDNHLSEDGRRLYNASIGTIPVDEPARSALPPAAYQVTVVDTATLAPLRTWTFERGIRPYVLTHDESRMYAQLSEFHGVVEIDPLTGQELRRLELPVKDGTSEADYDFEAPHHGLALSADERTLCAAGRASDYVALVDRAALAPTAFIAVPDAPGWAATGPDGNLCFVPSTRAGTLSVISYEERREVARLKMGLGPKQIEAARIPEEVVCARPGVPGCSPRVALSRRCLRDGRLRVRLLGDLVRVRSARFSLGGRRVRLPLRGGAVAPRGRRVRAVVTFRSGRRVVLTRSVPRC